jgi:hypothetical protein
MRRKDGSDLSSTINRGWAELRESKAREWEYKGMCDDYYVRIHKPCGTELMTLGGLFGGVCPKCQPKEWAAREARDPK